MNNQHLLSSLTAIGIVSFASIARAQTNPLSTRIPVADNSRIGTQVVETTSKNFTITGGVNLGQNLLHSFTDFSVPTGGGATFDNLLGKQSIITRVTGGNFSDIDGLVNTQGANFFLLNPNGIVFGKNVELNVGQKFVGSTANGIDLVDGGGNTVNFLTNQSKDTQLLTINPNALFNASRLNMGGGNGQISNFGRLDTNNPNQYIGLIGGNVSMNGGVIIALGGRVELGGLSVPGTVTLGVEGNNLRAQFPTNVARGDVSLTNQAGVNVAGAGGSDIAITARNLEILGGSYLNGGIFPGVGTPEAVAGDIKLNATGKIVVANGAIFNDVSPNSIGQGGNIIIDADTVSLEDSTQITSSTAGIGNAGNINITVTGSINLTESQNGLVSGISTIVQKEGKGNGGNITINAGAVLLKGALLQSSTAGTGDAGNISVTAKDAIFLTGSDIFSIVEVGGVGKGGSIGINANSLSLKDSTQLAASTAGKGNAGNIAVTAKDTASLESTIIFGSVLAGGVGKGGDIDINANSLSLKDVQIQTAILKASTTEPAGQGDAGNINLKVTGAVDISGKFTGGIFTIVQTGAVGSGGNITIDAGSFSLLGEQLGTSTFGQGRAGNVSVTTKNAVSLVNGDILSTVEPGGVGKGGNIDIRAGSLSLKDGAQLQTATREASAPDPAGQGDAGSVNLKVTGAIDISGIKDGFASGIRTLVEPGTIGNGGNITVDAGFFSLGEGAKFTASTFGKGDAGKIQVNATDFVNIFGSSGLIVNSYSDTGTAGDIIVTSPKITLNSSLINATSASGNGGNIQIGGKLPAQSTSIQGSPINPADTKILSLRRGSQISTNASGTNQQGSNGGNITITAPNGFIVTAPNENSDISANGFSGSGGKVDIKTKQNFWISPLSRTELQQRLGPTDPNRLNPLNPLNLSTNDITAISQVNPSLSGQVSITPPQIDITAGLSPLPNNVTDPTNQINPNCSAKAIANNSFTSVGRGGIPATPKDPLNEQEIATNWVRLNPQDTRSLTPLAATPAPATQLYTSAEGKPIVEAQAWRRERNGDIVLVATASGNLSRPPQPQAGCVDR
jgi:filamentous hemagglutinin family protein